MRDRPDALFVIRNGTVRVTHEGASDPTSSRNLWRGVDLDGYVFYFADLTEVQVDRLTRLVRRLTAL